MTLARALSPLVLLLLAACSLLPGESGKRTLEGADKGTIGIEELDGVTKNFADRYVQLIAAAANSMKRHALTPEARSRAHLIKLGAAASAWDMATDPKPAQQLVNLAVLVELQNLVWNEERRLGTGYRPEDVQMLADAIRDARLDVHRLCDRTFGKEHTKVLEQAVRTWRTAHPDVGWINFVRLDTIAEGSSPVHGVLAMLGSTLNSLNPFDSVSDTIDSAQAVMQRMFFYAKRLPMLMDWQAEAAVDHLLDLPEARDLVGGLTKNLAASSKILAQVETWSSEDLEGVAEPLRSVIQEARGLSDSFQGTLAAIRSLKGDAPPDPNAKPFDINEYRSAAAEFSKTAHEATQLLQEARATLESPAARQGLDGAALDLARHGRSLATHVALLLAGLLILAALLVAAVRSWSVRLSIRRQDRVRPSSTLRPIA